MTYSRNYLEVCKEAKNATVIAVSKGQSAADILAIYEFGCRDFGENRIEEAVDKIRDCPKDIRWHFIGNLQSNKVRKIVGLFHLIHSVDSLSLAQKISLCSQDRSLVTDILLQVNISGEASKQGFSQEELLDCYVQLLNLKGIGIKGLMTMAPLGATEEELRNYFRKLADLKEKLNLSELSMGMSQDYKLAVAEGATLLRIGTAIFS